MKNAFPAHLRFLMLAVLIQVSCAIPALAFYHPEEGRWINRDPIEEEGGKNLYAFAENASVNKMDPLGLDIYLTTGNKNASPRQAGNRYLHQEICVDTWRTDPNNKCCKIKGPRRCYSFAATGIQFPWPSFSWLGFDSFQFGFLQGSVYVTGDQGIFTSGTLNTSCQQDETFLEILNGMNKTTGAYSVLRHSCRTFSQQMFEEAIGLFPPQSKPSNSKCECSIRNTK